MSVFDRLIEKATGMRKSENMWGQPVEMKIRRRETGEIRPYTLDANKEHELSATLAVRFWANSAQLESARKVAERALANLLYHDVLGKLSEIEHAVMDSDGRRAFQVCGELRAMLTK